MKIHKHLKVETFTNPDKDKMFSVRFNTGPDSLDTYRGWKITKAKKVAKMFRKLAKQLEQL